jgi:adenylate cyclase
MMTLLFCDIRGFTSISEQLKANPQGLTRLLNRFLTPMTDIILSRRGTIDKYIGDCIMAFWNAPLDDPDHAEHACRSALAMIDALAELNATLEAQLKEKGLTFNTVNKKPFQEALKTAGFYAEWRGKFGEDVWKVLERYSGGLA